MFGVMVHYRHHFNKKLAYLRWSLSQFLSDPIICFMGSIPLVFLVRFGPGNAEDTPIPTQ